MFRQPHGSDAVPRNSTLLIVRAPTEGNAKVYGYDVHKQASVVRNCIGVVPREYTLGEDLAGSENTLLCPDLNGILRKVVRARANELQSVRVPQR